MGKKESTAHKGKQALITGANGFIGSFLAERLLERGYQVFCMVRSTSNLQWIADLNVELVYANLHDKESLARAVRDMDYIFHLAGVTKAMDQQEYEQGNLTTTQNMVDVIIEQKIKLQRFLFTSSQAAYGPSPTLSPIDETAPQQPLTWYGTSKLAAQDYVLQYTKNIPVTIVVPPVVYGPRDTDVLEFFKAVKRGIVPLLQGKDRYASLIHVSDLVDGIILAAEHPKAVGETYFMANPAPYSWSEIARVTLDALGKKAINISIPLPLMRGIAALSETFSGLTGKPNIVNRQKVIEMQQDFWICSPKKAAVELGFTTQLSLEDGIKDTLAWYIAHNWL